MTLPRITDVIDKSCREVKAQVGHDVSASEGRAFTRRFFFQLLEMDKDTREAFIKYCLEYYDQDKHLWDKEAKE